ncbi:MAG: hypothetical protein AB8I08_23465 [Sandaracinaceae bacterium]
MTERDQFVRAQVEGMLQPGEQIINIAFVRRMPSIMMQVVYAMCCIWLLFFNTTNFYAALTNRRIILLKTQFWFFRPKIANQGVEEMSLEGATNVTFSGFLANQAFTVHKPTGEETLRLAPQLKIHQGQRTFKEDVAAAVQALSAGQAIPPS